MRLPRVRFRWVKRLLVVMAICVAILGVIVTSARYILLHIAWKRTKAIIAALDKTDPRWRFREIEADRKVIPEAVNSAVPGLEAERLIPITWPRTRAVVSVEGSKIPKDQENPILILCGDNPTLHPDESQLSAIRAELMALAPALVEARKLVDMPEGRYAVAWAINPLETLLPHAQQSRNVARLLRLDAILRVHDGDGDAAIDSCRALLNVGRSLGDEPLAITQLVRIAIETLAVRSVEHVLAEGEPSDEALAAIQALLEAEESEPLLRIAARGERATLNELYVRLVSGEVTSKGVPPIVQWLYGEAMATHAWGTILEEMETAVAVADAPLSQQQAMIDSWGQGLSARSSEGTLQRFDRLLLPAMSHMVSSYVTSRARLRTAVVAVAAERYRRKQGRWPESAEQLTPWPLSRVPGDPHTDEPLIWLRSGGGLAIYSTGPNLIDDEAALEQDPPAPPDPAKGSQPSKPYWNNKDIGFRLRDVSSRRRPPP